MAKKKSRSANVARKREKRNRDRKIKNKRSTSAKQRKMSLPPMDEERFFHCVLNNGVLLEEPEFENLYFDIDMMSTEMIKVFGNLYMNEKPDSPVNAELEFSPVKDNEPSLIGMDITIEAEDSDELYKQIHKTVFGKLITPEFKRSLFSALEACENRLNRIGDRDNAEIAQATSALFKFIPSAEMVDYPLVQGIGSKTLNKLTEQQEPINPDSSNLQEMMYEIIEKGKSENDIDDIPLPTISDKLSDQLSNDKVESNSTVDMDSSAISVESDYSNSVLIPAPNSFAAQALYKTNDDLAVRDILNAWDGYSVRKETGTQYNYYNEDEQLYISVTKDRLQLHAHSEEELINAMEEIEGHCQSTIIFLAKTVDEGGKSDGTE